jgi:membrane protein
MSASPASVRSTWRAVREESPGKLAKECAQEVSENRLLIYASAIAYRGLVTLIPLILLGFALLSVFGLRSTWENSIKPAVDPHVQKPVAQAINFMVDQIFTGDSTGLIVFALAWSLWNMTLAVGVVMQALNQIHEVTERRSLRRRVATALWLAAVTGGALVTSLIVLSAAPLIGGGFWHALFSIGRWIVAPVLLGFVVELLFRYAPAERPETEWASAGSGLVILVWLVASAVFLWWATVANYKSATGNLAVLLTITLYIFISATIFLIGAQLDELLRKESRGRRSA